MKELDINYIAGLVLRAKADDSNAFAELYALTYNKLYNYARNYMRDDYLAQDVLQEVFVSVLKNINKLTDPTLFIAWTNRICFNVCYDMTNKLKGDTNQYMEPELMEIFVDENEGRNPESSSLKRDEHERLNIAMEKLSFNERQVLVMRFYNNMKLEEIASAMDISRSSVKRYIASAQEHLKTLMKG